jgi:hypothetical protein
MTKWFDDVAEDLKKGCLECTLVNLDVIWQLVEYIEASGVPKEGGTWGAGGENTFADEQLAAALDLDPRTINAALAWLERRGHLIGVVHQWSSHGSIKMFDIPDPQIRKRLSNL